MRTRKIAAWVAAGALALGLTGAGLYASFTDEATATQNVSVGTFNIDVTAEDPAVVDLVAGTVTLDSGTLLSSAAGSRPFAFTVTSTGTIPVSVTVAASALPAPFSDLLTDVGPVLLSQGQSHVFNGGIAWTELGNPNIGQAVSVTYTITAAEQ
jgi:predicted ribosomally synthesized peptide with SipW-like signal peptide